MRVCNDEACMHPRFSIRSIYDFFRKVFMIILQRCVGSLDLCLHTCDLYRVCPTRPAETVNLHLWPRVKWLNSGFHFLITSTTTGNCMELITSTTTDLLICWWAHRTDHAPGVLEKGAAIVVDSVHGCQRHNFSPPVLHDTQVRRPHARIIYAIFW